LRFALQQAEGGTQVAEVCRKMASEATFYRWKQLYETAIELIDALDQTRGSMACRRRFVSIKGTNSPPRSSTYGLCERHQKPTDNAYVEASMRRSGSKCLGRHWFLDDDARGKVEEWRTEYNEVRPHSALVTGRRCP
jgi:transposase InsO family protein